MITVLIYIESRFLANRTKIRKFTENYLASRLNGQIEVGINIVGDRKMKSLNNKYGKISQTTDVLSFSLDDPAVSTRNDIKVGFSPDKSFPDKIFRIGDVIISYPQAVLSASETNTLVDKKIEELIAHGLEHLLGNHHD